MNNHIAMMAADPDSGARKVGTYDIPADRKQGGAPPPPPPERRSGLGWLWWLLGIIILLALLSWAFQSCFNPGPAATVTPTAEAVTTEAAGAVDNTAFCTAVTDYDTLSAEAPAITADTPTADVRSYYDRVAAAGGALTGAAASIPDLDLNAFNASLTTLGESITGLTGDVVGDAAEGLNAAFTGVTDAITGVRTAAVCP